LDSMRRLTIAVPLVAIIVSVSVPVTSQAAKVFTPPPWLLRAERSLLNRSFQHAFPSRVHYIVYPKKIAVVFEFSHVVICGMCSSPTTASQPRGRVLRVSFDKRTHSLGGATDGWAIRFCEVQGHTPPKSACLHR
jgi:hypothetical protein